MIILCGFMDAYREIPPTGRPEVLIRALQQWGKMNSCFLVDNCLRYFM